jgi:hypothetical protein
MSALLDLQGLASLDALEVDAQILSQLADTDLPRSVTHVAHCSTSSPIQGLPEPARISLSKQVPFPPRLGRPAEYGALATHIVETAMLNGEVTIGQELHRALEVGEEDGDLLAFTFQGGL